MRKDYKPRWSPITEVPVIPVHEDLGGRDAPSQHPIEAIDGLAEALAGKVDADATKQLSTEDYTSAEKAKLAGIAEGAEANAVQTVKVNGTALIPDGDRAVDVTVPLALDGLSYEGGVLTATDTAGAEVASVDTGLGAAYVGASFDPSNSAIVFDTSAGDEVSMPMPSYRDGAEPNVIDGIVYDGVTASPDASKVVALDVYTKAHSVQQAEVDASTGVLTLKNANGDAISAVQTGLGGLIASASYDQANLRIDLVKADGSHLYIPLNLAVRPYAGTDSILLVPTDSATQIWLNPDLESGIRHAVKDNADAVATGNYTFQGPTAFSGPTAGLSLKSTKGAADTGQATCIYHYLTGDGSEALAAYDDIYLQSSRIVKRMRLTGRGGASQTLGIVANDDGTGYAVAPSYLPSDGNGGTAAPSDGTTVITQAMLAASPSVVHTAGDEAIAGTKDFTGTLRSSGSIGTLSLRSSKSRTDTGQATLIRQTVTVDGADALVGYDDVYLQSTRVTKRIKAVGRDGTEKTMTLVAADDGTGWATAPSYLPDDGSGGVAAPSDTGTVITQAMLAASPSVVHRTGDESIAGTKDFTGTLKAEGAVDDLFVATDVATNETKAWCEIYRTKAGTASRKNVIAIWLSYMDGTGGGVVTVRRGYLDALLQEFGGEWSYGGMSGQSIAVVRDTTGSEAVYKVYAKATAEKRVVARRVMEHDDGGQYGDLVPSSDWERGDGHAHTLPSGAGITVKQINWS
jgi:hypothetical protein